MAAATSSATESRAWSVSLGARYGSGLYQFNEQERQSGISNSLGFTYRLNDTWSTAIQGSLSTRLNGVRETNINDTTVTVSHAGGELVEPLRWNAALTGTLPTSKRSRKTDDLITALTLRTGIILPGERIHMDSVNFSYGMSLTKAFHRFKTNFLGESVKEYSMQHSLVVSWRVLPTLSVSASGSRRFSRTPNGGNTQSFGLTQSIQYSGLGPISLAVGHMNGGDVLKANGQDSNIAFVDKNSSTLFAAIGYQY